MSTDDRGRALSLISASADLEKRLDIYVDLITKWRGVVNLISERSFGRIWTRHIADSAQLLDHAPLARRWVDLGSGAGFPGMVIALQLAERADAVVHCIESDQRKAAFLRQVARATGAPASIHPIRIQSLDLKIIEPVDAITSRALARLPQLVKFANVWLANGAVGVFPCGRSADSSLQTILRAPQFETETFRNRLDPDARIIRIRSATKAH